MGQVWYTPRSAAYALREVGPVVERLSWLYQRLESTRPARIESDQLVERGYLATLIHLARTQDRLRRLGVQVHDPRQGRIGFPARRAGREVLLCWTLGEKAPRYWHERGTGFDARRPVDPDGPWESPQG